MDERHPWRAPRKTSTDTINIPSPPRYAGFGRLRKACGVATAALPAKRVAVLLNGGGSPLKMRISGARNPPAVSP